MLLLTGLVLLAAPVKIASAGLGGVGVDEQLLSALGEKVAQELATAPGVTVITRSDVAALLGVERQKQLLGCAEDSSSCVTELAGALGADLVLSGDVARVGTRYTATLKLLDARTGRAAYSGAGDAATEDELLQVMNRLARAARATVAPEPSSGLRVGPLVTVVGGVVAAGAGAVLLVLANENVSRIRALGPSSGSTPEAVLTQGAQLRDQGKLFATLGAVLVSVGGAAAVAGLVWWLWPSSPRVALVPTGDGLAFSLGGAW